MCLGNEQGERLSESTLPHFNIHTVHSPPPLPPPPHTLPSLSLSLSPSFNSPTLFHLQVLVLRNHGALAMGETIEESVSIAQRLVKACDVQVSTSLRLGTNRGNTFLIINTLNLAQF